MAKQDKNIYSANDPLPPSPYEQPEAPHIYQQAPPPQVPRSTGFFGCMQNTIAIAILAFVVVIVAGGTLLFLVIRDTGDTTEGIVGDLTGLLDGGPSYTAVEVRQLILAEYDSFWLETYRQVQVVDVTASNEWPGILPGRRSLSYKGFVTISAGVDLGLLQPDDIQVDGDTVTVTLPPAQIKDCILDEAASLYYDRRCSAAGVVDAGCGGLEDILRQQALYSAATENTERVYDEALKNAGENIEGLLEASGIDSVQFVPSTATDVPTVATGGTCAVPVVDAAGGDLEITIEEPAFVTPTPMP